MHIFYYVITLGWLLYGLLLTGHTRFNPYTATHLLFIRLLLIGCDENLVLEWAVYFDFFVY